MKPYHSRKSAAVAIVIAAFAYLIPAAHADRPTNFVIFFVDDLGWADVGCYGNDFNETPNIDRLATQGMRFTDAYAAPVCSPTRGSILTGRYPASVGITDFIPGHWRPFEQLVVPPIHHKLPAEEVTLAEVLEQKKYVSGYVGKWHLGGGDMQPSDQGFVELPLGGKPSDFMTVRKTAAGVKFMEEHRDDPFLLFLSYNAVHIPLRATEEKKAKYEAKAATVDDPPSHPHYAAMLEHIDDGVGQIAEALDRLNLADDTLFIFYSDNGGLIRRYLGDGPVVTTNEPLRGEKGTVYEGGIRVPLIMRWPGVVEPGTECNVPVTSCDMLPTLADGASCSLPENRRIDGESLVPLLKQSGDLKRDAIFTHYPHYHHMDPAGAIRIGDLKLIEHFDDGELELYDLASDIGETENLATAMPDLAEKLAKRLAAWRAEVGAKMPKANPDHDPNRAHVWKRRKRK